MSRIRVTGAHRYTLQLAVQRSKLKTVETLLRLGATVDVVDLRSKTPLHVACQAKRREWTRYSRSGFGEAELDTHPQYQGTRGEAAKYFELRNRRLEAEHSMIEEHIVEYLLDYGANPLAADGHGFTPLHYACEEGNPITVDRILRGNDQLWKFRERSPKRNYSFSSVLSARDTNGQLPLHCAARSGNVEVVRLLLSANLNRSVSSIEPDPWLLSEEREDEHVPQLRVEASTIIVNAIDNTGYTALHWAAKRGHQDVILALLKETSVLDVTLVSTSGHTALELAASCGHTSVVEVLEGWNEFYYPQARTLMDAAVNTDMTDEILSSLRQSREPRSSFTGT